MVKYSRVAGSRPKAELGARGETERQRHHQTDIRPKERRSREEGAGLGRERGGKGHVLTRQERQQPQQGIIIRKDTE
jgi:hypothetical protein